MDEEAATMRLFRGERFEGDRNWAEPWVIHSAAQEPQSARDRAFCDQMLAIRLVAVSARARVSHIKKYQIATDNFKEGTG